jgi:hypothetical protein
MKFLNLQEIMVLEDLTDPILLGEPTRLTSMEAGEYAPHVKFYSEDGVLDPFSEKFGDAQPNRSSALLLYPDTQLPLRACPKRS